MRKAELPTNMSQRTKLDYHRYFSDFHVKPGFSKEYVSLWSGWLGTENMHKLDEVTEAQWECFNRLIVSISNRYELWVPDHHREALTRVADIAGELVGYSESMDKSADQFSQFLIPQLGSVITEEWDYTFIVWYQDAEEIETLKALVENVGLHHFSD